MPAIKQVKITSKITTEQLIGAAKYALKQDKLDYFKTLRRNGVITNAVIALIPTALVVYFGIDPSLRLYFSLFIILAFLLITHHFKAKDFNRLKTHFLEQAGKTQTTETWLIDENAQIKINDTVIKPKVLLIDADYYYLFYIPRPITLATYNMIYFERSTMNNNIIQTDLLSNADIDQFEQLLKNSVEVVIEK